MKFFWSCPSCFPSSKGSATEWPKEILFPAASLNEAKEMLELHEKEVHKGKQIGKFGVTYEK